MFVLGVVANDGSPPPCSVHNTFGLRMALLAMTALAASRIVWVER